MEASRTEKCGPLCQHPGCWQGHQRQEHGERNETYYINYLSQLVARKPQGTSRGSSLTVDGLPTLKVQTLVQDHGINSHHGYHKVRTRANSLPPVITNTKQKRSRLGYPQKMKQVHFLQMHLEDDVDNFEENELFYSPVLIWKPGKHPHTHHHTHPPRYHTCTPVHVNLLDHQPECPSPHPAETKHTSLRRVPSPLDISARKNSLHLNRTDLTLSLPARDSSSELLNDKTVKSHRRITTADAECFSYLGDIPKHVVAEILQQLRSESSSNIDESPVQSAVGGREIPLHQPSSLIYNQSTNKLSDTKQTTPTKGLNRSSKKRLTSFSRELSKRPLEVLRKKTSDHNNLQSIPEESRGTMIIQEDGVIIEKTVRTLKPSPVHLATIQPITTNRSAGRHSLQLESLQRRAGLPSKNMSRQTGNALQEVGTNDGTCGTDTSAQPVLTKAVTLELDFRPSGFQEVNTSQIRALSPKRSKKTVILKPSYNSPRPFSEETNTTSAVTPAIEQYQDSTDPNKEIGSQRNAESRVMSSMSPDFMLVGAHFAGDHLVLVDRGGEPIVHQLTDTESIVNIAHTLNEGGQQLEQTESADYLIKPLSGARAPPSTATEVTREQGTFIQEDTIQEEEFDS